jgi:hypothetical protein
MYQDLYNLFKLENRLLDEPFGMFTPNNHLFLEHVKDALSCFGISLNYNGNIIESSNET